MPQTQAEMKEAKVATFMSALENYVRAEIHDHTSDDPDTLGAYHEQVALREALKDLVGHDG